MHFDIIFLLLGRKEIEKERARQEDIAQKEKVGERRQGQAPIPRQILSHRLLHQRFKLAA